MAARSAAGGSTAGDNSNSGDAQLFPTAGLAVGPSGSSAAPLIRGSAVEVNVTFSIRLNARAPYRQVQPFTVAMDRFNFFESVQLESAEATILLGAGDAQVLYIAVRAETDDNTQLSSAPYFTPVPGSSGATVASWSLDTNLPFSRELKATVLGNPPAAISFGIVNPAGTCDIRLTCRYSCRGVGIPDPIRLSGVQGVVS